MRTTQKEKERGREVRGREREGGKERECGKEKETEQRELDRA